MARKKIPRLAQTKIRLPTTLRRDLQRAAGNKRPLNAEIIRRLEQSLERDTAEKERAAWMAALLSTLLSVTDRNLPAEEAVKQLMALVTGGPQQKDGVS